MRLSAPALALLALLCAIPACAQEMVECRDLGPDGALAPNEKLINGKACRPAGTPLEAPDVTPTAAQPKDLAPASSLGNMPTPPPPPALPSDGKIRVFVTDSQSWETKGSGDAAGSQGDWGGHSWFSGGARPQTAEIIKTLNERCPEVIVTDKLDRANFVLTLDHEGGKGALAHRNKVAVFNHDGDDIFSASTRELGNAVKDACHAMMAAK